MSEHNKGIENTHTPKNRYKGSVLYVYVKIKTTIVSFTTKQTAEHFSESDDHSVNAGVRYKNREFVTHSKLPHHDSAVYTFIRGQKWGIMLILAVLAVLFISNPVAALGAIIAFLSIIYFLDSLFTLYLVRKNLNFPSEVVIDEEELKSLKDSELPVYTILAPLYKEFEVLPDFVENIKQLDYPKKKLDVVLLLEENDAETIALAKKLNLPKHFRTLIVPHSKPKTKPKACNYGLWHAKGEYVVIYDAEDRTDPQQLKKAFLAFKKQGDQTACIQAKLNYFNSNQNLLTRFFTAEYSLWFDVILPGFQSINTPIPLGGTSNHFKVSILKELHGWDAFNVTEDCDLGIRLFKKGYKTAIIDSVTWEEANSEVKNWIRQRSRWIKGYLQTYLVHMRRP